MSHPLNKGQYVRCIRAPEIGIPISEGSTYQIASTFFGNPDTREACTKGMEHTPGVSLEGVDGYYTADRFEPLA